MSNIRNISIPKPCHQSWNEMTPEGLGRHCQQCSKVVTDFTAMSNAQIIDYFNSYGNVCGRFGAGQLNSLNNELELEEAINQTRWKKWTIAASLFLATALFKANAQSAANPQKLEQSVKGASLADGHTIGKIAAPRKADSTKTISGTVYDATNNLPLSNVTIRVAGTNTATVTNAKGKFSLRINAEDTCINISYLGFKTENITTISKGNHTFNVKLIRQQQLLGEVIIEKPTSPIKHIYYKFVRKPFRKIFS